MTNADISQPASPTSNPSRASAWRRGALAFGLVGGGFVLGAVTLASADGGMPWHGHHHGPHIGMIQHVVHRALDNVGATTAQEDKIHDIIANAYTQIEADQDAPGKDGHEGMRKQIMALMSAPTIDRAAVEKLRTDQVAKFDAKSKAIVAAALDAAGQLTPEQRNKLVQEAQERMDHRGWGGWHHDGGSMDGRGGPDGGPNHGPDHDHGPDHGDHG